MVELNKYIVELKQDCVVDEINLKDSALMLPAKKAKWVSRLILEKNNLHSMTKERNKLLTEIMDALKKEAVVSMTKSSLKSTAETHEMIVNLDSNIEQANNIIDFLERCEKVITSMSFDIGNIIKIVQLETT